MTNDGILLSIALAVIAFGIYTVRNFFIKRKIKKLANYLNGFVDKDFIEKGDPSFRYIMYTAIYSAINPVDVDKYRDFFYEELNDNIEYYIGSLYEDLDRVFLDITAGNICLSTIAYARSLDVIGFEYFTRFAYMTGFRAINAETNTLCNLVNLKNHGLCVWSKNQTKAGALLEPSSIKVSTGSRSTNHVSARLKGFDTLSSTHVDIELRIYCVETTSPNGYVSYNDIGALTTLNNLIFWIHNDIIENKQSRSGNINSSTSSELNKSTAGDAGELLVKEALSELKGSIISDLITTNNMVVEGKNFEIDFLVLTQLRGLVLIEVKYYSGNVLVNGKEFWTQQKNNISEDRKNASLQAVRTKSLLEKLLLKENLKNYKITPLVVFSHPDAVISQEIGCSSPQSEVITLTMLKEWLSTDKDLLRFKYSEREVKELDEALKNHEKEYVE